jgi:hypothetical protein
VYKHKIPTEIAQDSDNVGRESDPNTARCVLRLPLYLTHCGRVTQICAFNTVKLGTSASSPSATPQGEMFPEVSHPQALLGSLVFPENFSSQK